jgi:hypothetical protein
MAEKLNVLYMRHHYHISSPSDGRKDPAFDGIWMNKGKRRGNTRTDTKSRAAPNGRTMPATYQMHHRRISESRQYQAREQ